MSPEYFLHRLTLAEAIDYIKGQDRRHRQSWCQTRLLAGVVHKLLTGEDFEMKFSWEEEPKKSEEEMSEEERQWEEIKRKAEEYNTRKKSKNG